MLKFLQLHRWGQVAAQLNLVCAQNIHACRASSMPLQAVDVKGMPGGCLTVADLLCHLVCARSWSDNICVTCLVPPPLSRPTTGHQGTEGGFLDTGAWPGVAHTSSGRAVLQAAETG